MTRTFRALSLIALGLSAFVLVALQINTSARCSPGTNCEIGDSLTGSIQLVTDGTGDTEVVLPASSIGFAEQNHVTIGASPAATCTAGQIHIDTDESVDTNCTTTADNSLCLCTAADTWTALENN